MERRIVLCVWRGGGGRGEICVPLIITPCVTHGVRVRGMHNVSPLSTIRIERQPCVVGGGGGGSKAVARQFGWSVQVDLPHALADWIARLVQILCCIKSICSIFDQVDCDGPALYVLVDLFVHSSGPFRAF